MSFYLPNEEFFVKKVTSAREDAIKNSKTTLFKFLNEREVELVKYICGNKVNLYFSEVTKDDEYKRALISPFDITPDFKIAILKLDYNKRYLKPNHRMTLGAILSLGIERNAIGDIYITTNEDVYISVIKEIKDFLQNEFRILSHQSVSLFEVDSIEGELKDNYDVKSYFVSSLRLDLIIAERLNLSRNVAQELISKSLVKVNQKPITNTSHQLEVGNTVSIKGYGRIKLIEVGGVSKGGKIFLKIGKLL